jgi:hypothetical protein
MNIQIELSVTSSQYVSQLVLKLDHAAGCSPFLLRGPKALVAERGVNWSYDPNLSSRSGTSPRKRIWFSYREYVIKEKTDQWTHDMYFFLEALRCWWNHSFLFLAGVHWCFALVSWYARSLKNHQSHQNQHVFQFFLQQS